MSSAAAVEFAAGTPEAVAFVFAVADAYAVICVIDCRFVAVW